MALSPQGRKYYSSYADKYREWCSVAVELGKRFEALLSREGFAVHSVEARAKSVDAMLEKLRRKGYRKPGYDVTDRVGVRIISYHSDVVDAIESTIRSKL